MLNKISLFLSIFVLVLYGSVGYSQNCEVIYVTPNGASSAGAGTQQNPASLNYAISQIAPGLGNIRLAAGTYTINNQIDLVSGLTVEGGYDPATWNKVNTLQTVINRTNANVTPNPNRIIAISAVGITNFGVLDLTINVEDAVGVSVSTYGIYLSGSSFYSITRCFINAGSASDGIDGVAGVDGQIGQAGQNGQNGLKNNASHNAVGGLGGNGGLSTNTPGGNGGNGAKRGVAGSGLFCSGGSSDDGLPGAVGTGVLGGAPGNGGQGWCRVGGGVIGTPPVNNGGGNGGNGGDGANGANGANGVWDHVAGFFVPGDGQDGDNGHDGGGGGGGGGGGA